MTDKRQNQPIDRHAAQKKARDERLGAALRANLKRRKAAVRTASDTEPERPGDGPEQHED